MLESQNKSIARRVIFLITLKYVFIYSLINILTQLSLSFFPGRENTVRRWKIILDLTHCFNSEFCRFYISSNFFYIYHLFIARIRH